MNKPLQIILAVFGVTTLAGCLLGPDYQRPDQQLTEEFRQTESGRQQDPNEVSFALQSWREIYQDPQLQWLIETGLQNNLDLAIAGSRIEESRALLAVSRSALFPQLDVEAGTEREKDSGITNSDTGPENTTVLDGWVSWEIDLWGQKRRSVESAEADWRALEFDRQAITVSLVGEIATAYFKLLDIDNRLAISKDTVETRQESVRIARLRKEGGVISKLEVTQAEVELATAKVTIPTLLHSQTVTENQLSILLGMPPGDIERHLTINQQILPSNVPAGLPAALLRQRPDIQAAEQKIIAANAGIGVAEAEFYPKLVLTGAYGRESYQLSELLNSSGETWLIGLDAAMPIFNAGRNKARLEVARQQYEQACLGYRRIVLRSLQEVSSWLETYRRSEEALDARYQLMAASEEYVRLARLQYYNGVLSYLDLLDAQRQLFNAELSLSESKRDRLLSLVQLYKALGGGWQAPAESEEVPIAD